METTEQLAQTPLYDWHVAHGGRMVDFAGWAMPVQYKSIVEEHQATRSSVGLFDISHMGRLKIFGPDASKFLDCMLTRRVADMREGQIRYSLVCNAEGGILDDVLIYFVCKTDGGPEFLLVVNASNRTKIIAWLKDRITEFAARLEDTTRSMAMIAIQGPDAVERIDSIVGGTLGRLKYYHGDEVSLNGKKCYLSRTGYTGEDGGEIICGAEYASVIWEQLTSDLGGIPCGLGARDTLRLEAAMPLYGHELSEEINPIQAGLKFAVSVGDRDFIGREAIEAAMESGSLPVRVGLQLEGKRVAREGSTILLDGNPVGQVTSGTYSPTLDQPIAMGYIKRQATDVGTPLQIDIRGKQYPARVVPIPFYKRTLKEPVQ